MSRLASGMKNCCARAGRLRGLGTRGSWVGRWGWAVDQPPYEPRRVEPALAAARELAWPDVLAEPEDVADDAAEL